jgi:protein-S-isoprenylcysteine O-methyltransferase Ste14
LKKEIKSILLVIIQFSCIGFLLFGSRSNKIGIAASIIIGLSIVLASWSIFTMQKSKLIIFPEPSANAILITSGPYQYIRHPMYTSVLLCCLGFLLIYFNIARALILVILLIDLLIKLHWEEAMLKSKFKEYWKYCENTNKLFPFIY